MKRILLVAVLIAAGALSASAQEIVVFRDYRSLSITSHRVQGPWTYLRLPEGEIAVLTTSIQEYRKEPVGPVQAMPTAPPLPTSNAKGRPWTGESAPPPPEPPPEESYTPPEEEPPPPPPQEPPYMPDVQKRNMD